MPLRNAKNKSVRAGYFAVLAAVFLFFVSVQPGYGAFGAKKKPVTGSGESGLYRVYYMQTDDFSENAGYGKGKFRRVEYKAVYQDDWWIAGNRKIEIALTDDNGFKLGSDLRPERDFNKFGECYGSFWIGEKDWKRITGVSVKEIVPKAPKPAPVKQVARAQTEPVPVGQDNAPRGLFDFGRTTYTDEMIKKELESRHIPATRDNAENTEAPAEDSENPEVGKAVIEEG